METCLHQQPQDSCTLSTFFGENVSNSDRLTLATLGDSTKIERIVSLSLVIALNFANGNTAKFVRVCGDLKHLTQSAQQSVTKVISPTIVILATPKAIANTSICSTNQPVK